MFVECKPVDVTTLRTTPRMGLGAHPFATPARVNGGVLRMNASWRSPTGRGTPNRCVSASRPVGPSSIFRSWESPLQGDLPPPRAQENVAEKAQPRPWVSAEMGRSTDADGERECAETSPPPPLHRPLDKPRFIDAHPVAQRGVGDGPAAPIPFTLRPAGALTRPGSAHPRTRFLPTPSICTRRTCYTSP